MPLPSSWLRTDRADQRQRCGRDAGGSLVNTGLIQAETGNVTLLGSNMTLAGVVGVTTSVSHPGSIVISTVDEAGIQDTGLAVPADRRSGQLIVSGVIANLPEEDGQTVPSDGGSFVAGSINLTGGSVWLQNGSLIEAPGASVGLTALSVGAAAPGDTLVQGRVYLDNGATVDVAGISDVELPISDILVTIPLIGQNELADSPLLRNSFLNGLKKRRDRQHAVGHQCGWRGLGRKPDRQCLGLCQSDPRARSTSFSPMADRSRSAAVR